MKEINRLLKVIICFQIGSAASVLSALLRTDVPASGIQSFYFTGIVFGVFAVIGMVRVHKLINDREKKQ